MSLLLRVHSAAALFTGSHSSVVTCSFFSSSHFCLGIRIGSEMWSEYLLMIDFSFQALRNSSSPSRRCRMTSVPRAGRSMVSTSKSPVPSLLQRTPWLASSPARRDSTVMRSATMKPE